jgi:hypothetical protein
METIPQESHFGLDLLDNGELCELFTSADDIDPTPVALALLSRFPAFARRWRTTEGRNFWPWLDLLNGRRFGIVAQDPRVIEALADMLLAAQEADTAASDLAGECDAVLVPTFVSMLESAPGSDVPVRPEEDRRFDRLFFHPVIATIRSSQFDDCSQPGTSPEVATAAWPAHESLPNAGAHVGGADRRSGAGSQMKPQ